MTRLKFMIALCIGTLVYAGMSIVAGRNGIMAYEQLYEQNELLTLKTEELKNTCEKLELDYAALKSDTAKIESLARKLGYIHEGETVVTFHGIAESEPELYDTGTVIRLSEIYYVSEKTCKIMGMAFFVLSSLFMLALDIRKKRNVIVQEPEYEIQQI